MFNYLVYVIPSVLVFVFFLCSITSFCKKIISELREINHNVLMLKLENSNWKIIGGLQDLNGSISNIEMSLIRISRFIEKLDEQRIHVDSIDKTVSNIKFDMNAIINRLNDVHSNLNDVHSNLNDVNSNLNDVNSNLNDVNSNLNDIHFEVRCLKD